MKAQSLLLYAAFAGLIGVVILLFYPYPGQKELMIQTENEQSQTQQAPDPQSMSPQYGDLSEQQIKVADRAIMELLNAGKELNPSMITVLNVDQKEYPDASLGCQKGRALSAQVVTLGYQVILVAQGVSYDYRLDMGETVMLCEK